jgi:hypothetical protein
MEVVVDAYEVRKDGIVDIKAYRYTGITVLGDSVNPAMVGANMQVIGQFNDNQKFSQEFYERVEKLNFELKQQFNTSITEGGEIPQMTIEKEGDNVTETELSFSATYRQKREALQNALDPVIIKDANNNVISETYYWLDDFSDQYCMVEKYVWSSAGCEESYGRFTYSFDDSALKATITSEYEKLIKTALTQEEYDKVQAERNSYEQLKTQSAEFEATITTLKEENQTLKTSNEELTTYKNDKEKESYTKVINEIFAKFEDSLKDNQTYIDYKEKVSKDVLSFTEEAVNKELLSIYGGLTFNKNEKKNNKPTEKVTAEVINIENEEVVSSRYGSLEKYLKK